MLAKEFSWFSENPKDIFKNVRGIGMEIENDFEVIFENGISILKGHLIDSTEINFLKDPFSKSR